MRASTQRRWEIKPWTKIHAVRKFASSNAERAALRIAAAEIALICEGSDVLRFYFLLHALNKYTRDPLLTKDIVSNGMQKLTELIACYGYLPDTFLIVLRPWSEGCCYKLTCGSYIFYTCSLC